MKNMRIEDIEIEVIKKNIKNMYIYMYINLMAEYESLYLKE